MHTLTRCVRGLLVAMFTVGFGAALWFGAIASASADTGTGLKIDLPASGGGFTASPTGQLIDELKLAPGFSTSGIMGVLNSSTAAAAMTVSMNNVVSSENGCTHPELAEPGGCSAGPGQLAGELVFAIAVSDSQGGTYTAAWTGSAAQLQSGVHVTDGIAAGSAEWVRLSVDLPMAAGNEVQSDTFGFGLRVTLESNGSSTSAGVGGVTAARGGGTAALSSGSSGLAFTGVPAVLMSAAGLLLVLSGVLLIVGVRTAREE